MSAIPRGRVLTTFEAGRYCRVNPYTVRRWIEAGGLKAYATPGGHRRIRQEDLDAFLLAHGMPLPEDFTGGAKRILLASGEAGLRSSLAPFLSELSGRIEVRTAIDPFFAGYELGRFRPHLLFLDLDLRGLCAESACRAASAAGARTVVLTAQPAVELLEAALAAGAVEYLVKPPDYAAVRRLLRQLFPYVPLGRGAPGPDAP